MDAGFLENAHAEEELNKFLTTRDTDPTWRKEAWMTLSAIAERNGNYGKVEYFLHKALEEPNVEFTRSEQLNAEMDLTTAHALRDTPPQAVVRYKTPAKVLSGWNKIGLLSVNLSINGIENKGVFDTMSNNCLISESAARYHKLRLLNDQVTTYAATSKIVTCRIGVSDELNIGGTVVQHVVFLVFRDQDLFFLDKGEGMNIVLGLAPIIALGTVKVAGDGSSVEIGSSEDTSAVSAARMKNLAFDGLTPLIKVQYTGESLPFMLDTGGGQTFLAKKFGKRFPETLFFAKWVMYRQTAVGGSVEMMVQTLPTLDLSVNDKLTTLHNTISWIEEQPWYPPVYGTMGSDSLRGGYVLNFQKMQFLLIHSPD